MASSIIYKQNEWDPVEKWHETIRNTFGKTKTKVKCNNNFTCTMNLNNIKGIKLIYADGTPHTVRQEFKGITRNNYVSLFINMEGILKVIQNKNYIDLNELEACFIDLSQTYEIRHETSFKAIIVSAPIYIFDPSILNVTTIGGKKLCLSNTSILLYVDMLNKFNTHSIALCMDDIFICSQIIKSITCRIINGFNGDNIPSYTRYKLNLIENLVDDNISDFDLDRTKLAQLSGYSIREVNRTLSIIDTSANNYIKQRRMKHASDLLSNPSLKHLSITGVSLACGYSSLSTFCSDFLKYYGITAKNYQKKA